MVKVRYALILTSMLLLFAVTAVAADPLNATERAWLQDKGTIIFVSQTAYPPFEFLDSHGNPQGMCIELIQWMAAELGFKTAFRDMAFKEAQEAVLSGEVDVLTSLFYSKEREKRFDFSEMTWEVPALIFVRAERPDITSLADLQGKRIAMQRGDYAAEFLSSKGISYDLVPTATFAEATDRVIARDADAVIGDRQIVLYHLFSNDLTEKVKSVGQPLYIGRNGMGVRKGRSELVGILNKGFALAHERGVFDRITSKWVGTQYARQASWLQRHAERLGIALVAVGIFAALVVIWAIRLRNIVIRRTHELFEARNVTQPITPHAIGMSSLKRWLWVLVILIPLCAGGAYVLRNYVILPSFLSLEKQEAKKTVSACVDAVMREMHHLGQIAGDWAMWDDTYQFVQDENPAYVKSNFQWESLISSGIHLIYVFDPDGRVVWGSVYDPIKNSEISLDAFSKGSFSKNHHLLHHETFDGEITGIVLTEQGPMLVASRPIVTSAGEGPMRGTLVMGRFLTEETIQALSKQTRVRFRVKNPLTSVLDKRERELLANLPAETQMTEAADDDVLKGYGLLTDLDGNPALLITATLGREIFQHGKAAARIVSLTILAIVVIIGICLFAWSVSFLSEVFQRQAHIEALVEQRTAALQESENKFRELADLLPQTVFETDAQGQLTYANQHGFQSFGYTDDDLRAGAHALAMLIPEQRDKAGENIMRIMNAENVPAKEYTALRKDGTTFPAIIYSNPIRRDGTTLGIRGIIVDITDRKQSEVELERLAEAIKQASDVIVITNKQGAIEYVNPAFEEVTGYSQEEVFGQNPKILKSGQQDPAVYRQLWDTISSGKTWKGTLINRKKDGSLYTEEATISPVRGEAGEIINFVAVKRDITERIRLVEEKDQLEHQYQQSQKVEAIGRLAGGVAHDLNNLLSPILGYAELLLGDLGQNDPRRNHAESIMQAGMRARDLIRQLLAFSRKQTLEYKSVNLNIAVAEFAKLLRHTIREDIGIEIVPAPDIGLVKADIGQIEQVMMNLAVNAQDAMPDGGKLTIETARAKLDKAYASTRPGVQPGEYIMMAVSDTGHGMDSETLEQVFEPFFSTKGELGTGLGLATAYGIVKQHGGNIWVYSEPGKGTTFKIYLPVADNVQHELPTGQKDVTDLKGSETILLVEDNQEVRDLAATILNRQGYDVLVAKDSVEAIEMLRIHNGPVHLMLTDVVMPGMNGRELYDLSTEKYPGLKVLYMSGYPDNVISHRGVLDNGVQFIQKPFSVYDLAIKVREVLEQG